MSYNDRTDIESVLEVAGTAQAALPVISPPRTYTKHDVTTYSTPYADAIAALGAAVKAWWRFNDAAGSSVIADEMGFANGTENNPGATLYEQTGLITEHDEFSQGAVNSAVSYMTAVIPAGVPLAGGFTLVWWMTTAPLAMFQNAMKVGTDGPSQVLWACFDGAGSGGTLIGATPGVAGGAGTFGAAAMYAITYTPGATKFYKNGVLIATSAAALSGTRVSSIGYGAGGSGGAKFGGFMDEITLFTGALSAADLLALHAAGVATIQATTTETITDAELVPSNPNQIGVPSPQGAIGNTVPVPVGAPTLATEGPVQGTPAPRIAGVQLVPPPAPPPPAIAGQFSQPANAPQSMLPISTLRQG